MLSIPHAAPRPRFLELTIVGEKPKKLYMPASSVLTYEEVPEGKNEQYPTSGTFLRYDYGEGLSFAFVSEPISEVRDVIGINDFLSLRGLDGGDFYVKKSVFVAAQEQESDGVEATKITLQMSGQVGSLFVADPVSKITEQLD